MTIRYSYIFMLIFVFFSCNKATEKRKAESIKELKKKELIFSSIEKAWVFNLNPASPGTRPTSWQQWNLFLSELKVKPRKSFVALQKKTSELSTKVSALNEGLPSEYNNLQMKSRIAILITKIKMLDLYLHLNAVPDKKVIALIPEINSYVAGLQQQMSKISIKSKIPLEEGESELLRLLDTARAIPNTPQLDQNISNIE